MTMETDLEAMTQRCARAERTLQHAGYTDLAGSMWMPPLGAAWAGDDEAMFRAKLWALIHEAGRKRYVLTIDLVPQTPLAMGNYIMVPDVRPARVRAEPIDRTPEMTPEQQEQWNYYSGDQWTPEQLADMAQEHARASQHGTIERDGTGQLVLNVIGFDLAAREERFSGAMFNRDCTTVPGPFNGVDIDKAHERG